MPIPREKFDDFDFPLCSVALDIHRTEHPPKQRASQNFCNILVDWKVLRNLEFGNAGLLGGGDILFSHKSGKHLGVDGVKHF